METREGLKKEYDTASNSVALVISQFNDEKKNASFKLRLLGMIMEEISGIRGSINALQGQHQSVIAQYKTMSSSDDEDKEGKVQNLLLQALQIQQQISAQQGLVQQKTEEAQKLGAEIEKSFQYVRKLQEILVKEKAVVEDLKSSFINGGNKSASEASRLGSVANKFAKQDPAQVAKRAAIEYFEYSNKCKILTEKIEKYIKNCNASSDADDNGIDAGLSMGREIEFDGR